jgi:hypothetical protein
MRYGRNITIKESISGRINGDPKEALAKPLKGRRNRHSGQAKRDPESRIFKREPEILKLLDSRRLYSLCLLRLEQACEKIRFEC